MTAIRHGNSIQSELFDSFLEKRATAAGEPFVPFALETDCPRYVDGKPRYDGKISEFISGTTRVFPLSDEAATENRKGTQQ